MKIWFTMMIAVFLLLTLVGCGVQNDIPGVGEENTILLPESAPQTDTDEAPTHADALITDPTEAPALVEEEHPQRDTPPLLEEEISEPELTATDVEASINISEIIGRNFVEHRHLFGNVINWLFGSTTHYIFDLGISLHMKNNEYAQPDWIFRIYVQFREPENERIRSSAVDEGFLGYEKSQRFHFDGISHESTQADVEAAFPIEYFNRAYVRELSIFGDWILTADGRIPGGDIGIDLLEPYGEHSLISRLDEVIYWNDYFAIVFEFSADDGKVIDMLVFGDRI